MENYIKEVQQNHERFKERWKKMTGKEREAIFQKAGILDKEGELTERYKAPKDDDV